MVIEEKTSLFEGAFAIGGILIAIIATFSSPKLDTALSREELVQQRDLKAQRIAELEAALVTAGNEKDALKGQLVQAGSVLEAAQTLVARREAEIEALKVEREELNTRVVATAKQLRQADSNIEELKSELAEFQEILSVEQVKNERDAALERATEAEELVKEREDRIRELTLRLDRAIANR